VPGPAGRVATEAAWLNGNNCEKEEINEAEKGKKRKDERKVLTLTGLLMEGDEASRWFFFLFVGPEWSTRDEGGRTPHGHFCRWEEHQKAGNR
jgi:hypothetical protein